MSGATPAPATRRRLPQGKEIFLDHVGHYVRNAEAASRALRSTGFAPTPVSIQSDRDPASGGLIPTGTGNVTAMFARGYIEVLFKTSDSPLARDFEAGLARGAGLHLAAFSVADAADAHARLVKAGFPVRDLLRMQRPVKTETGPDIAAFSLARAEPASMPEGRIQILTHHTEHTVWQPRWVSHPNGVTDLIDVIIAVADLEEAAQRFARFTGHRADPIPGGGALIRLDRGGIYLLTRERATEKLPEVPVTSLPFMLGYALGVESLGAAEAAVDGADLEWRAFDDGIVANFPSELGEGAWFFVERAENLPWRH
jgi:hypothetical protein